MLRQQITKIKIQFEKDRVRMQLATDLICQLLASLLLIKREERDMAGVVYAQGRSNGLLRRVVWGEYYTSVAMRCDQGVRMSIR